MTPGAYALSNSSKDFLAWQTTPQVYAPARRLMVPLRALWSVPASAASRRLYAESECGQAVVAAEPKRRQHRMESVAIGDDGFVHLPTDLAAVSVRELVNACLSGTSRHSLLEPSSLSSGTGFIHPDDVARVLSEAKPLLAG